MIRLRLRESCIMCGSQNGNETRIRKMGMAHKATAARKILSTIAFIIALFAARGAAAQVPVALLPPSHQQFFLPNGTPNAGGCLFFFNSGTSTPAPTYTDITGTIEQSNPVVLDSSGYATVYLQNQEYRVQMWTAGGTNCASGTQVWQQDGVSAYQPINNISSIVFSGVTSYPTGIVGELLYRTDLGRLCFFNSAWDCIPGLATLDTFTNKSIDLTQNTLGCAPNIAGTFPRDNGTQLVCANIQGSDLPPQTTATFTNSSSPGTTLDLLAILTGAPSTAAYPATTVTSGVVGVCISGCGMTGSALLATSGLTSCVFDAGTTAGDYVQISPTVAGNCHDSGASYPTSGQVIGRILSTNAPSGTYQMDFFSPEAHGIVYPTTVYSTASSVVTGSIPTSPATEVNMFTPTSDATFRFSWYAQQVNAGSGCSGATTLVMTIYYGDSAGPTLAQLSTASVQLTAGNGGAGPASGWGWTAPQSITVRDKSGYTVGYSVGYTEGSGCSLAPSYRVFPVLEQMSAN